MKNPLTLAGIEPATFRFVAQHINHCATAVPYMPRTPPISFYLILSPEQHLVQHENDEAPPECNFPLYPATSSFLA
jgi:sterol desaturase/sphingolipid hydroxylase (fatty acid hydroxylase superfamily)